MSHSVLSALTASVVDAAVACGWDRTQLLAEAGLDPALLADPDLRVPLERHFAMWEVLSRQPTGLAIGEKLGVAGMGVVGYAMQHGSTVGQALEWLERLRAVVHPEVVPDVVKRSRPEGERMAFSRPISPPFARLREPVYAQAASILSVMRSLTGRDVRARYVAYPLPRPDDPDRHERYFGAPVSWGGPLLEVAFDASLLDVPLPRRDPRLFTYLARRASELLESIPDTASAADRARHEIGLLLASGEPRLGAVAQRMAMSERTLHRRLEEAGTTFGALVEDVRRERAMLLLEDRRLSSSEVAFLLGYGEPAAFYRAFKRWTGTTPGAWRESQGQAAGR